MQLDTNIRTADTQKRIKKREDIEELIRQKQVDKKLKEDKVRREKEKENVTEMRKEIIRRTEKHGLNFSIP